MCGLFVSVGTSAQFSHLRHRIAVMERGCYLSQTKQSGELFCRSDTMRQRQLPTTYLKSQVRAARTSQSPFCHSVTFPLSGESLFEAPKKRSHDVRSFCFCLHLCTVLSPATSHCSNGTRLLTGSPCPAAGGRKRGAVSRKKYRVQRPLQGQLHDNISDRSQVREHLSLCYFCTTTSSTGSSCSYLAVTLLSLRDISPARGISV